MTLSEYIQQLQTRLANLSNWDLNDQLQQVYDTYQSMLHYMVMGVEDANMESMQRSLWHKAIMLDWKAQRIRRIQANPNSRYAVMMRSHPSFDSIEDILNQFITIAEISERRMSKEGNAYKGGKNDQEASKEYFQKMDKCNQDLFNLVWTSDYWTKSNAELAARFLKTEAVGSFSRCVLISAVTLALTEMWDIHKALFLINAYETDTSVQVSQRALVGFVLALRLYSPLITYYPELKKRLYALEQREDFVPELQETFMQLQYSSLTDTVINQIDDDLMMLIMNNPKAREKAGIVSFSMSNPKTDKGAPSELGDNDSEELSSELSSRIEKHMQKVRDSFNDGADVHYATFSSAKSQPFFSSISHWFYPFTSTVPELSFLSIYKGSELGKRIERMFLYNGMCSSDAYSLCGILSRVGEVSRESLEQQLSDMFREANFLDDDDTFKLQQEVVKSPKIVRRKYIHDLYRFFRLYPYNQQFNNPFDTSRYGIFTPFSIPVIRIITTRDNENRLTYGSFLMQRGCYEEALSIFHRYLDVMDDDANVWQNVGFCEQKLGKLKAAKLSYIKADALMPSTRWTLSHLGNVAFQTGDYKEARDAYQQLLDTDQDNVKYITRLATCHMRFGEYNEALRLLYKANYLEEGNSEVRSLLAQALIHLYDNEKALTYADDAILRTLIHVCDGNLQQAYGTLHSYYAEICKTASEPSKELTRRFNDAISRLAPIIDASKATLICDAVIFDAL